MLDIMMGRKKTGWRFQQKNTEAPGSAMTQHLHITSRIMEFGNTEFGSNDPRSERESLLSLQFPQHHPLFTRTAPINTRSNHKLIVIVKFQQVVSEGNWFLKEYLPLYLN
ncbi:hypothetical protein LENED_012371 [Lentinula edodes]|uniref:Uncharacterized protein n=1 Tax=Lentinula edodes TaxID=5353 RepID=A0A1Q3ESI1_LENED|nr:hypothetical protein LENED_012371 [Lentinula edodes]